MTADTIRVSSGEPGGELEIGADAVVRRLRRIPWQQVEPVLRQIPELHGTLGLVRWAQVSQDESSVVLRHPRVRVISYPHEWCGEMLHDAALAHCRLLAAIVPHGLVLQDAHPWNALFDAAGARLVDVGSIVPAATLAQLDYLRADRADPVFGVFRVMFLPYFVLPLAFHGAGLGDRARAVLWRFALNGAQRGPHLADYMDVAGLAHPRREARGFMAALAAARRFRSLAGAAPGEFAQRLSDLLAGLTPGPSASGYTGYYASKGEDQALEDAGTWNPKQRNVATAIDGPGIETVLDVACNTGWYARMAARRGKKVTAVDVDGACISSLYRAARQAGEDIVPLVGDVAQPAPDRERRGGGLLMLSAERRLKSDAVLALGILHHLVLGSGLPLADALQRFSALATKRMVVEFVGPEDDKVRGEPGFFPALARDPGQFGYYSREAAQRCLVDMGWKVEILASYPATRSLLVCSRTGD